MQDKISKIYKIIIIIILIIICLFFLYFISGPIINQISESRRQIEHTKEVKAFEGSTSATVQSVDSYYPQRDIVLEVNNKKGTAFVKFNNPYDQIPTTTNSAIIHSLIYASILDNMVKDLNNKLDDKVVELKNLVNLNINHDQYDALANDFRADIYLDGKNLSTEDQSEKIDRLNKEYDILTSFFSNKIKVGFVQSDVTYDITGNGGTVGKGLGIALKDVGRIKLFPNNIPDREKIEPAINNLKDKDVQVILPTREEYIKNDGYINNEFPFKLKELAQFYK